MSLSLKIAISAGVLITSIFVIGLIAKKGTPAFPSTDSVTQEPVVRDQTPETPPLAAPEAQYSNASADLIVVNAPLPGATIANPVSVSGTARGTWFFEASAPVVIVDWDGKIIGQGYITANDDWMTEDFVPFTGTIDFDQQQYGSAGAIIFRNDNPSGEPSRDRAVEIPITFGF